VSKGIFSTRPECFTTANFHRPEDLLAEAHDAGFDEVKVLAVEGPAWSAANFGAVLDVPV
jgi:hypothetical protein